MINPEYRFSIDDGALTHAGQKVSRVIDWDQRRWYTVKGPASIMSLGSAFEIEVLKNFISNLADTVYSITVNNEGLLISATSDPKEDETLVPLYPSYSQSLSLQGCQTIKISELLELDRLGRGVDVVGYTDSSNTRKEAVFRYTIVWQDVNRIWRQLHIVKALPKHPNIVPFHHIVLDDSESQVLGFTTAYVPGGSLDRPTSRRFKLEWLRQLTNTVDYLNLELGIVHQDITPRNLVFDKDTDQLRLVGFDSAAMVGSDGYDPERNDVKGVILTLYEIITMDMSFRQVPHNQQGADVVQELGEWPVRIHLDLEIIGFRIYLNEWVARRKRLREEEKEEEEEEGKEDSLAKRRPSTGANTGRFDIPEMHRALCLSHYDENGKPVYKEKRSELRRDCLKDKKEFISWQRPALEKIFLQDNA